MVSENRSAKVTDQFICISVNVSYCITCTLCKKIFREHLRDVEENDTDASKPVARHFNLPNQSYHNMTICYPYSAGTQKAAKISNKNSSSNWEHSLHTGLMNASHSTNLFTNSCDRISKAPPHSHINLQRRTSNSIHSVEGLTLETSAF